MTSDQMEAAYGLVHLWKRAVEKAGSFKTAAVRQALREGLEVDAPGGPLRIDPGTQHAWKRFRLGRIHADRQFDIVHESAEPTRPIPPPRSPFPAAVRLDGARPHPRPGGPDRWQPLRARNPSRCAGSASTLTPTTATPSGTRSTT
ncbi:MAG: hypothetical protein FJ284_00110 [Planctomycetes bacterium]|nr:hypothetical protein [Planctomycetota bacterium]